jgi:glutamate synthase (NADPH/NADH) large chain/glutamate synthase (ferredoxin)
MNPYYHPSTPLVPGSLHRLSAERDNCGMGAIAQIHGKRSYQIIDFALCSVCNMTHRGAVDADMKTGDGSGILSQIPYPIFLKAAAKLGTTLENESDLAVAVFFLPLNDDAGRKQLKAMAEERGLGLGKLAQPLRAALTGTTTSPGIFDVLVLLGRDESLARIADQAGTA